MNARETWKLRGPVRACRLHRIWFTRRCGADACETEESGDATDLESPGPQKKKEYVDIASQDPAIHYFE